MTHSRGKPPFILLALVSLVASFQCACAGKHVNVTNLPAGVTLTSVQDWISASTDLKTVSDATHAMQQGIDVLHTQVGTDGVTPIFPDGPAYGTSRLVLAQMAATEIVFANWLKTVPNGDFTGSTKAKAIAFVQQLLTLLQTLNADGITGIKDAAHLAVINGFITDIQAGLNLIATFAGATPAIVVPPALIVGVSLVN